MSILLIQITNLFPLINKPKSLYQILYYLNISIQYPNLLKMINPRKVLMIAKPRILKIIVLGIFLELLYLLFEDRYYFGEYLYFFIDVGDEEQIDESVSTKLPKFHFMP
jgi:hypothetical protein